MTVFAVVILVMLGLSILVHRNRILPITITVVGFGQQLVGVIALDELNDTSLAPIFAGSILVFWLAYVAASYRAKGRTEALQQSAGASAPHPMILAAPVVALSVWHLAAGGIPILSPEVETARFAFNSGLFGIPGRMYILGLPFVVVYASLYSARHPLADRRFLGALWACFVAFQLASGFKGAIATVLITWFFASAVSRTPVRITSLAKPRYVLAAGVAALVAIVTSFNYQSLALESWTDSAVYLAQRATVISAAPAYYTMTSMDPHGGSFIGDDLNYFALKYTSTPLPPDLFPLDQIVSSKLTGTRLSHDAFIAPVTLGAFASWYADLGPGPALFAMGLLGWLYAFLLKQSLAARESLTAAFYSWLLLAMANYLANGALAYWVINALAVAAGLVVWGKLVTFSAYRRVASVGALRPQH